MLLLLLACQAPEDTGLPAGFPDDFHFGSATAGFQVDPGCPTLPAEQCEDRASDWYQWVTDPDLIAEGGLYLSGEPLSAGPGHWELVDDDLERAANELHHTAYRSSLEWSRLFPDGGAEAAMTLEDLDAWVDADALVWYQHFFERSAALGLEPVVTLNHYTLPLWVHDGKACHTDPDTCTASGWLDADRMVPLITLYAAWCARTFGEHVTWWLTLNEPMGVVIPGFAIQDATRSNPPGLTDTERALGVFRAMAVAHAAMADAVRAQDADARVGVVANVPIAVPYNGGDEEDILAAEHMDWFYNELFLQGFLHGRFDVDLDGALDTDIDGIEGRTDWLGVNHYNVVPVLGAGAPVPVFGNYEVLDFIPMDLGIDRDQALDEALARVAGEGLPMWVTENGIEDPTDDDVALWLEPTLDTVREAAWSMDLRGYLAWSLIDNYEWNLGTEWRFGLYAVDPETKERSVRAIGTAYAEAAAGR